MDASANYLTSVSTPLTDIDNIFKLPSINSQFTPNIDTTKLIKTYAYNSSIAVKSHNVNIYIDGTCTSEQIYTFGKNTTEPRWVFCCFGNNTLAYANANDIRNLTVLGKTIFSTSGNAVAWNGTMWVAVGNGTGNTIAYSYDGITWTGLSTSIFSTSGNGIAWNGKMWIAAGTGTNRLGYSYDGINWTGATTTNILVTSGNGVAWNGNLWVAVGSGGNTIAYSSNGTSWNGATTTNIFSTSGNGVAWNGNMWIAGGQGTNTLAYSYDGMTWTIITSPFTTAVYAVAWNGTTWIAGGSGTYNYAYSYNGIIWIGINNSSITNVIGLAFNNIRQNKIIIPRDTIVAVGTFTTGNNSIAYSYDKGATWIGVTGGLIFNAAGSGYGIAYNGKMWVAGGNGTNNTLAFSYDGITWNGLGTTHFNSGGCRSIATNGKTWIAGGWATNESYTLSRSYDGINWHGITGSAGTIFDTALSNVYKVNGVEWTGKTWVAVGGVGTSASEENIAVSDYSGTNWTSITTTATGTIYYAVKSNGLVTAAVGTVSSTSGLIVYSYDYGNTWSANINISITTTIYTVEWNGLIWVAGGVAAATSGKHFIYSYDGITWTGVTTDPITTASLVVTKILWVGTQFIASTNDSNKIYRSPDGKTWSFLTSTSSITPVYNMAFSNNKPNINFNNMIVAVGTIMAYSMDGGYRWKPMSNQIFDTAYDVAWNGNIWVAVGQKSSAGCIAYSTNGLYWTSATIVNTIFTIQVNCIAWNGSIWLAGGSGTNTLASSPDGITWTAVTSPPITNTVNAIAWNGKQWLVTGKGTNTVAYSSDGTTWTAVTSTTIATEGRAVIWTSSGWIVGGTGTSATTRLITSNVNLSTWTSILSNFNITRIATNGEYVVMTTSSATNMYYMTIPNISSISSVTTTQSWTSVTWTGNMWLFSGGQDFGYVYTNTSAPANPTTLTVPGYLFTTINKTYTVNNIGNTPTATTGQYVMNMDSNSPLVNNMDVVSDSYYQQGNYRTNIQIKSLNI